MTAATITKPEVKSFFDEMTFTATHVVTDPVAKRCAIIDPVLDLDLRSGRTSTKSADQVASYIEGEGLTVDWIMETHVHADHLSGARHLKDRLKGRTAIGDHVREVQVNFKKLFNAEPNFRTDGSQFDHLFADNEKFQVGDISGRVLHTPGHTPACVTYVIGDAAFVGDTLFMPDYGTARADFPGGDARTLFQSIHRILSLSKETRLFLCHDYKAPGREVFAWESTVGVERERNIHVRDGVSEEDFVATRSERDKSLSLPSLIFPSLQVNMRAGDMPPPEENSIRYLKIPINVF